MSTRESDVPRGSCPRGPPAGSEAARGVQPPSCARRARRPSDRHLLRWLLLLLRAASSGPAATEPGHQAPPGSAQVGGRPEPGVPQHFLRANRTGRHGEARWALRRPLHPAPPHRGERQGVPAAWTGLVDAARESLRERLPFSTSGMEDVNAAMICRRYTERNPRAHSTAAAGVPAPRPRPPNFCSAAGTAHAPGWPSPTHAASPAGSPRVGPLPTTVSPSVHAEPANPSVSEQGWAGPGPRRAPLPPMPRGCCSEPHP